MIAQGSDTRKTEATDEESARLLTAASVHLGQHHGLFSEAQNSLSGVVRERWPEIDQAGQIVVSRSVVLRFLLRAALTEKMPIVAACWCVRSYGRFTRQ